MKCYVCDKDEAVASVRGKIPVCGHCVRVHSLWEVQTETAEVSPVAPTPPSWPGKGWSYGV